MSTGRPASRTAWAILIGGGGTSATYNIFHAVHGGTMTVALALLFGIIPVFLAACVSHIVAAHQCGPGMKAAAFAVMLGAMGLSIHATAVVVAPAAGTWGGWLFGAVVDSAALIALRIILGGQDRSTAEELTQARTEAANARAAAAQERALTERLEADLGALREELETARSALQERAPVKRSAPARPRSRSAPADDLAVEARALNLLATDLTMSGAELARQLGVSPGYGRKLRKRLTAPDRPVDRSGAPVQDRSQDRP